MLLTFKSSNEAYMLSVRDSHTNEWHFVLHTLCTRDLQYFLGLS